MTAEKTKIEIESDQDNPSIDSEGIDSTNHSESNDSNKKDVIENESDSDDKNKPDESEESEKTEKSIEDELEEAKEEADRSYDRFLRVSAEFENFKKRATRDKKELRKFANQYFAKDLLTVIDNLERAVHSSKEENISDNCLLDGVELTLTELLKIFEKHNITQIESVEQPFDPKFHQAVMREETDEYSENTVINEMQKGYLIHDRLLRPSMVVVAVPVKNDKVDGAENENSNDNNNEIENNENI